MIRPLGLLALAALACTGTPDDPDTASDTAVDGWPDYGALADGAFATAWGLYDKGPLAGTFDEGGPREQTLDIAVTGAFVAGFAL